MIAMLAGLLCLCAADAGQAETPPVLGLVHDPALADEAALLTAALSDRPQWRLVERQRIEAVLAEHALLLEGLSEPDALTLGQLLHADGLLILAVGEHDASPTVSLRLVAVQVGVVLWKIELPGELTDAAWAQGVAEHVRLQTPKLIVPQQEAVPVSVLNVRDALPSPEAGDLGRTLQALLVRRLVDEPKLFVLERSRMDLLMSERALAEGELEPFWRGRYLIDGVVGPQDDAGMIEVQLTLRPPGGEPRTVRAVGERDQLPALVDTLAHAVAELLLDEAVAQPWDLAAEARRFADEATWAERVGLPWPIVAAAAESAHALGHRSRELTAIRLRNAVRPMLPPDVDMVGRQYGFSDQVRPWLAEQLKADAPGADDRVRAHAQRLVAALRLHHRESDATLAPHNAVQDDDRYHLAVLLLRAGSHLLATAHAEGRHRDHAAALATLRRKMRTTLAWLRLMDEAERADTSRGPTSRGLALCELQAGYGGYWYDDPAKAMEACVSLFDVPIYQRPVLGTLHLALSERLVVSAGHGRLFIDWSTSTANTADLDMWMDRLADRLKADDRPWLSLTGATLAARLDHRDGWDKDAAEAARNYFWQLRDKFAAGELSCAYLSVLWRAAAGPVSGREWREVEAYRLAFNVQMLHHLLDSGQPGLEPWELFYLFQSPLLTREQAEGLAPKVASYFDRLSDAGGRVRMQSLRASYAQMLARFPDLRPPPGDDVLVIDRLWHPWAVLPESEGRAYTSAQGHWSQGLMWITVSRWEGRPLHSPTTSYLIAMDLISGDVKQILTLPAPEPVEGRIDHGAGVTVTEQAIYVQRWPTLDRYDRVRGEWTRLTHLHGAASAPIMAGDSMYLRISSQSPGEAEQHVALVRASLDGSNVRAIASMNHNPPRHALDAFGGRLLGATDDPPMVYATFRTPDRRVGGLRYDPATDNWHEQTPGQFHAAGGLATQRNRYIVPWQHDGSEHWLRIVAVDEGLNQLAFQAHDVKRQQRVTVPFHLGDPVWPDADGNLVPSRWPGSPAGIYDRGPDWIELVVVPEGLLLLGRGVRSFWFLLRHELDDALRRQAARDREDLSGHATGDAIALWREHHQDRDGDAHADVLAFRVDSGVGWAIHLAAADGSWFGRLPQPSGWPTADSPAPAPDGRSLVYQTMRYATGIDNLVEIDLETGEERLLLDTWDHTVEADHDPVSPRLVFVSTADQRPRNLRLLDLDTGNIQILTDDDRQQHTPRWSPDGQRIVYAQRVGEGRWSLWLIDADGSESRGLFTHAGQPRNPVFAPDGKHIAFDMVQPGAARRRGIYSIDIDGHGLTRHSPDGWWATHPAYSPEGKQLAYRVWHPQDERWIIHVHDLATGAQADLRHVPGDHHAPRWLAAPAGKR